jgi:hypothetical protein
MAFYIVTGRLGAGKTLVAVSRIQRALSSGLRVATNLDLFPENMLPVSRRELSLTRLPDLPDVEHFEALGLGSDVVADESKFGLIVLDECAAFFNARTWADKGRQGVIDWLKHSRKLRWNVYLIVQSESMLDKQIRDAFGEHLVVCKRMDRLSIPFVGPFFKLLGVDLRPPKIHVGIVRYGLSKSDPVVDRWMYRGHQLYDAYNTEQIFDADTSPGLNSALSPYHVKGRIMDKFQLAKFMARGLLASSFTAGALISAGAFFVYQHYFNRPKLDTVKAEIKPDVRVQSYVYLDGKLTAYLSNGQVIQPTSFKNLPTGMEVFFNGQWIGSQK